jgi:hypothetical protein
LWSPSGSQLIAYFEISPREISNYLLAIDNLNDVPALPDVSARLPVILAQWEEEIAARETKQFALLPPVLQEIATASAVNVYFSPNDKKVFYTSTGYTAIPPGLLKTPPSTSSQPEARELEPGGLYIYDLVEDKNFKIGSISIGADLPKKALLVPSFYQQTAESDNQTPSTPSADLLPIYNRLQSESSFAQTAINFKTHYSPLYIGKYQWYPDSSHLLIVEADRVDVIEYDATNQITIYSGPFENTFAYPWPDGSKLIILTNLNPSSDSPKNLYGVDIR